MKKLHTQTLPIPGTQDSLTYERDDSGRLVRLSCNGRVYLHEREEVDKNILDELFAEKDEEKQGEPDTEE